MKPINTFINSFQVVLWRRIVVKSEGNLKIYDTNLIQIYLHNEWKHIQCVMTQYF
jgi:hypothetical protein